MLSVNTNVSSLVAQNNLSKTQTSLQNTFARLSSGFRINSAADDAAGLGISESLRGQIRSFAVAERNAGNGISMVNTAESGLAEISSMVLRMRELAVQASNGDLVTADRANIDTEFQELVKEIDRVAAFINFNGTNVINTGAAAISFQVGIGTVAATDQISVTFAAATSADIGIAAGTAVTDVAKSQTAITALDAALGKVSTERAKYGAANNRLQVAVSQAQSMRTNLEAANSRIRDVDVASETSKMARSQVLMQAGTAVLAQANQAPQLALSLLR